MTPADERVHDVLPIAMQLVAAVHDYEVPRVHKLIGKADTFALIVALAAMVPDDARPSELLGWTQPAAPRPRRRRERRVLAPCGTHASYSRHKARGEPVDLECLYAERLYQRNRKRQERAA